MSTYDWLTIQGVRDVAEQNYVEVSFKHGTRKDFYYCPPEIGASTSDVVVVQTDKGFDTGYITLSGELVHAQMAKRDVKASLIKYDVIRKAHDRDLERLDEARLLEKQTLVRARVLAYATESPMKLSDVEYQGDLTKATFFYTSETRIDFRELIKSLAREFRVRVEMRQIGARQEAGRLGGIGSCGRELCCSTWLTDFKSVNTSAARYQGLALNQTKLSGQCGRLKCCLNFELDTYLDALSDFPKKADKIKLPNGKAVLVKTEVFKRLMTYQIMEGRKRGPYVTMTVEQVHEVLKNPEADVHTFIAIESERQTQLAEETADEHDYGDVTDVVDIPLEKRNRKKKGARKKGGNRSGGQRDNAKQDGASGGSSKSRNRSRSRNKPASAKTGGDPAKATKSSRRPKSPKSNQGGESKPGDKPTGNRQSRNRNRRKPRGPKPGGGDSGK
jgi:cell fate regulator YaaT (PSP1 superfamily)